MSQLKVKSVRFYEVGAASVLQVEELPIEQPAATEVLIKVHSIGLNRAEVMFRNGAYLEEPNFPSKLGYEASGVVEAVGSRVEGLEIGDKVSTIPAFSMGEYGVYGEQVVVPEVAVVKNPECFSFEQSAAIWMQYITAYGGLLEVGRLSSEQFVVITAASSSVGVAAIHIAKNVGAQVIALTRGTSKRNFLLEQGADFIISTESEDLVAEVQQITRTKGVELVFDPIGGPMVSELAEIAAVGGVIVEYGALDDNPTPFPLFAALAKGLKIQGFTLFEITKNKQRLNKAIKYLHRLFSSNQVKPVIDKRFTLEEIQQAHSYMESNRQMGKIIVNIKRGN
jgi:NADPH:quinone reductase-like Zn-dependent oxidoreductase